MVRLSKRTPYAVKHMAGHGYSAESWGPGRAVARIPRVSGGGTHSAGSGAFGNQARGGHMGHPTKVYRKWCRKVNVAQRRAAIASCVAATGITALVQAKGHRVDDIPMLPCVVDVTDVQTVRTKEAVAMLTRLGAYKDVQQSIDSKTVRAGKAKHRNNKWKAKKGPLVVICSEDSGLKLALRNIPGVDVVHVSALNVVKLAPGGHMGRLVVWTLSAFKALDAMFGTPTAPSNKLHRGSPWSLPRPMLTNSDIDRIIDSQEVQAVIAKQKESAP